MKQKKEISYLQSRRFPGGEPSGFGINFVDILYLTIFEG